MVTRLSLEQGNTFLFFFRCSVQAAFYLLFLLMLSYALIYGSTREDPTQYSGRADGLRLFCEILTIIFLMFYFFEEVNQAERWVLKIVSLPPIFDSKSRKH